MLKKTLGYLKSKQSDKEVEEFIKIGKDGLQENYIENTLEFK